MKKENKAVLEMLACAALWSIAGIFIKLIPWNSFAISGMRSLIAGLTLLVYMSIKHYKVTANRKTLLAGLLMGLLYTCFVAANKLTTAANAIVLQFTAPMFIVIISALLFHQRIRKLDIAAVLFTMAGISLFFFDELEGGYLLGNLIAIFSGVLMAAMYITVGESEGAERFSGILFGQLFAFIIGLPFVIATKPDFSSLPSLYILILGVLQLGIPYILYAKAANVCSPLSCCLLGALEPLLNPVWVLLFDGEKPGTGALIGGLIVIVSVTAWCALSNKSNGEA